MTTSKILIVDDEYAVRESLKLILGDFYAIDTAENGVEGAKKLSEFDYSLVITDYFMPEMTGLEMVKLVRSNGISLPIVVYSGCLDVDHCETFREHGVSQIFEKPLEDLDEFTQIIEGLVLTSLENR